MPTNWDVFFCITTKANCKNMHFLQHSLILTFSLQLARVKIQESSTVPLKYFWKSNIIPLPSIEKRYCCSDKRIPGYELSALTWQFGMRARWEGSTRHFYQCTFLISSSISCNNCKAGFAVIIIVLGKAKTIHFQLLLIWYTAGWICKWTKNFF